MCIQCILQNTGLSKSLCPSFTSLCQCTKGNWSVFLALPCSQGRSLCEGGRGLAGMFAEAGWFVHASTHQTWRDTCNWPFPSFLRKLLCCGTCWLHWWSFPATYSQLCGLWTLTSVVSTYRRIRIKVVASECFTLVLSTLKLAAESGGNLEYSASGSSTRKTAGQLGVWFQSTLLSVEYSRFTITS